MIVAPVDHFATEGIANPAPARKMPQPDIAKGRIGENAAIWPVRAPAARHGGCRGARKGGEGERDQAIAC